MCSTRPLTIILGVVLCASMLHSQPLPKATVATGAGARTEIAPKARPPQLTLLDPMAMGAQLPGIQVMTSLRGVNVSGGVNSRYMYLDFTRWYGTCNPGQLLGGSVSVGFASSQTSAPLHDSYFAGLDVENTVATGDLVITRGDHDPGGVELKRCPVTLGAQRCVAEVSMPGSTNIVIRYWGPSGPGQVNVPILKHIIFGTP
jgi:hypothetical protein